MSVAKISDIEDSGLPENIQQLLKMIRKLQKEIAEKKALIEAVMADKRLSSEEKIIKVRQPARRHRRVEHAG